MNKYRLNQEVIYLPDLNLTVTDENFGIPRAHKIVGMNVEAGGRAYYNLSEGIGAFEADLIDADVLSDNLKILGDDVINYSKSDGEYHKEYFDQSPSMKVKEFTFSWSKTYRASGAETVEATDLKNAKECMDLLIGDLEGSMQYFPDENTLDLEVVEE